MVGTLDTATHRRLADPPDRLALLHSAASLSAWHTLAFGANSECMLKQGGGNAQKTAMARQKAQEKAAKTAKGGSECFALMRMYICSMQGCSMSAFDRGFTMLLMPLSAYCSAASQMKANAKAQTLVVRHVARWCDQLCKAFGAHTVS